MLKLIAAFLFSTSPIIIGAELVKPNMDSLIEQGLEIKNQIHHLQDKMARIENEYIINQSALNCPGSIEPKITFLLSIIFSVLFFNQPKIIAGIFTHNFASLCKKLTEGKETCALQNIKRDTYDIPLTIKKEYCANHPYRCPIRDLAPWQGPFSAQLNRELFDLLQPYDALSVIILLSMIVAQENLDAITIAALAVLVPLLNTLGIIANRLIYDYKFSHEHSIESTFLSDLETKLHAIESQLPAGTLKNQFPLMTTQPANPECQQVASFTMDSKREEYLYYDESKIDFIEICSRILIVALGAKLLNNMRIHLKQLRSP